MILLYDNLQTIIQLLKLKHFNLLISWFGIVTALVVSDCIIGIFACIHLNDPLSKSKLPGF